MISQSTFSISRLTKSSFPLHLAAVVAMFSLSISAHATSIVADGGFEAAGGGNIYYAGQSIDGGSWTVLTGDIYIDTQDPYVYAGNNSVNLTLANPYVPNTLSQTLTTVVGQTYDVSFWANADYPNSFSLTEDGLTVAGTPSSIVDNGFPSSTTNSSLFVDYTGVFTATTTSTILDLTATADPAIGSQDGSVMIDDVSVAAVPEPGSVVLMLTGILGAGLAVGRKRLGRSVFAN